MIKKEELEQLENLRKERKNLLERIEKLETKPRKILTDGVRGSSTDFPYTQHNCRIEGLDNSILYRRRKKNIKKLKKMYISKNIKIDNLINHIEYELNYVEDSEIRKMIRNVYEDGLTYNQTAHKMNKDNKNKYTADSIRMQLKRFFEKI